MPGGMMEDQFTFDDYEWTYTYHHGITGAYMKCHKTLKPEALMRVYNLSPTIRKFIMKSNDGIDISTTPED